MRTLLGITLTTIVGVTVVSAETPKTRAAPTVEPASPALTAAEVKAAFTKSHPGSEPDPTSAFTVDVLHPQTGGAELHLMGPDWVDFKEGYAAFTQPGMGVQIYFQAKKGRVYLADCRVSRVVGALGKLEANWIQVLPSGGEAGHASSTIDVQSHHALFPFVAAMDGRLQLQFETLKPNAFAFRSCTVTPQTTPKKP
jgi:hypothetical protein